MNLQRLLLLVATLLATALASQAPQQPAQQHPASAPAAIGLSEDWYGTWQGAAASVRPGGQVTGEYTMGLEIGPSSPKPEGSLPVYTWKITYTQEGQTQSRDYLLRVAADESGKPLPGHFILDQRNGTLVDQFLIGQTIQGHFVVVSRERVQILHARYELISHEGKPAIEVEIASYDGNEARRSPQGDGGVESRRLERIQRAVLLKQ